MCNECYGNAEAKMQHYYLHDTDSLRDGLHIMHESGYSAVPVVDAEGRYVGTVKEGDFLWNMMDNGIATLVPDR